MDEIDVRKEERVTAGAKRGHKGFYVVLAVLLIVLAAVIAWLYQIGREPLTDEQILQQRKGEQEKELTNYDRIQITEEVSQKKSDGSSLTEEERSYIKQGVSQRKK